MIVEKLTPVRSRAQLAAMKEAHGTYAVPKYLNGADITQVLRSISAT